MEETDVIVINREEEILSPNLSNVEKIGRMARLCYRVEPKENENQHDVDVRIIKKCIESGHESVLEHGVISVFINPEETADSKFYGENYMKDKSPINFHQLFAMGASDAQMKYLESFMDPELFDKYILREGIKTEDKKILPVFLGDVRAWRQIVRERVFLETKSGNKVALAVTLKLLFELDRQDPDHVLFGDLVNDINSGLLKDPKFLEVFGVKLHSEFQKDETLTLESYCKHAFQDTNTIFAGQASSCASISIIFTTDRAFTHQHVRHRKNVAYSQESQRYVNYDKKGFRVIAPTIDPKKNTKDLKLTADGILEKDQIAYTTWWEAMRQAFNAYTGLLETGLPPESARGVLPNDTATRLGVTWLRTSSFINFVFWRLDSHAQYAIRSTLARVIFKMFSLNHPFVETIPHGLAMQWFKNIKDQNLYSDVANLDKVVEYREGVHKSVERYIQEHAAELEAQRK